VKDLEYQRLLTQCLISSSPKFYKIADTIINKQFLFFVELYKILNKLNILRKFMKKKCTVCVTTQGKRGCLLHDMTLICPRCCAEIRNPACEGCSYYKESQKFALEKTHKPPSKHFTLRISDEVDDEISRALEMSQAGNIAGAEALIQSLMKENADLYSIHFAMGTIYSLKEQYDEAIACFDKSIAIFPYFIDNWFNRALTAQKKGDIVELVFSLHQVIEIGDDDDQTVQMAKQHLKDFDRLSRIENDLPLDDFIESLKIFNAAFKLMQDKQWTKAITRFKAVISMNPKSPQAFSNMGLCYAYLKEDHQAMEAFDQAIAIDPSYEPAIINKNTFKKSIAKDLNFSDVKSEIQVIEYGKSFPLKDKKKSLLSYIKEKLKR